MASHTTEAYLVFPKIAGLKDKRRGCVMTHSFNRNHAVRDLAAVDILKCFATRCEQVQAVVVCRFLQGVDMAHEFERAVAHIVAYITQFL